MENLTKLYFHMFQGKYVLCRLSTNFFISQRLISTPKFYFIIGSTMTIVRKFYDGSSYSQSPLGM